MDRMQDDSEKNVKTYSSCIDAKGKEIRPHGSTIADTQQCIQPKDAILNCFKILDRIRSQKGEEAKLEGPKMIDYPKLRTIRRDASISFHISKDCSGIEEANNFYFDNFIKSHERLMTQNWSDEICHWSATLQTYPKQLWCDCKYDCPGDTERYFYHDRTCIFCKQYFDVNTTKIFMTLMTGDEASSICSIPSLVYFNVQLQHIHASKHNVQVHFIDCTGEFSSVMEIPNSDNPAGAVWYAGVCGQCTDACTDVYETDKPFSLEFWKNVKDKKKQCVGFDVYPIKVANSIGEFFKKFEETGQVPRNSITDQITFTKVITQ